MPALALRGIVKRFGDLVAVDGVDLDLESGSIVGLIGENGAGKSTLANIAFGALAPDEGTIERNGVVGLVHQHFQLVERLSVWENVLLGREPRKGWRLDVSAARARVRELGERYGLHVDPDAIVETLPIGLKQRVELLRELEREPAVLLLDEPTAVLAPSEIETFFTTIVALAKRGVAILVVTHKLAEVIAYTSKVYVMRAGTIVARYETAQTNSVSLRGPWSAVKSRRWPSEPRSRVKFYRSYSSVDCAREPNRMRSKGSSLRFKPARFSELQASKVTGRLHLPTLSRA